MCETVCASFLSCDKLPQTWGFRQQTFSLPQVAEVQTQDAGGLGALGGSGGTPGRLSPGCHGCAAWRSRLQTLPSSLCLCSPASSLCASGRLSLLPASYEDTCRGAQGPLNPGRSYREALPLVTSAKTFFKQRHIHRLWGSALAVFVGVLNQPTAGRGQGPGASAALASHSTLHISPSVRQFA